MPRRKSANIRPPFQLVQNFYANATEHLEIVRKVLGPYIVPRTRSCPIADRSFSTDNYIHYLTRWEEIR